MQSRISYLFQLYKNDVCSRSERDELMELLRKPEMKSALIEMIQQEIEETDTGVHAVTKELPEEQANEILHKILNLPTETEILPLKNIRRKKRWWPAVAAALLLLTASYWLWQNYTSIKPGIVLQPADNLDVPPGTNGAILTLDNGRQIILDSTKNGMIAQQGGSYILKENGQLSIHSNANNQAVTYDILTTPRGRQFQTLVLADGSRVVLDAGSSIRFPTSFAGSERKVSITGQVWFAVTHKKTPFKVTARGTEIVDVGTEFNVNAYDDQVNLKVTLLKGAVRIRSSILKPGQQAKVGLSAIAIVYPDLDQVMAWKNNYFSFSNADIKTIMQELSRWYDIEVRYEGKISNERFSGKIGRNLSLRDLLDGLSQARVHYRIEEGRKLVIQL